MKKKLGKKGVENLTSTMFILLIIVTAFISLSSWFLEFKNNYEVKFLLSESGDKIDLLYIKEDSLGDPILGLRTGRNYHIISKVLVNGEICDLKSTNVIENFGEIGLTCDLTLKSNYLLEVFTNNGIYSKNLEYKTNT